MPKFLQQTPRVLVTLPTVQKACRDKLQGILRYAHLNGPWDVQTLDDHPFIAQLGTFKNWQPDGIIYGLSDDTLRHLVRSRRIPVVQLDPLMPISRKQSSVSHDSRLISETVADHFLHVGLTQFAFVGSVPDSGWSQTRADAFAARLKKIGFPCRIYAPVHSEDWGLEERHMRAWLQALPKPCGLMVAVDLRAKQVLDTCRTANIRVPEEIAVVGVDNDATICENTTPTLSSVLPDFEGGGYLAAELLDRLFRGLQKKPIHLSYGVRGILQRQSSLYLRQSDRLIASVIEFIRLNACAGITVADVVDQMRVSRRYAERHFRAACSHSILDEIQHHRLERVCALLRETNIPIREIGERCGYDTEIYLKVLFKKCFGVTMREYRKHPQMIKVPLSPPPVESHLIGIESNDENTTRIGVESTLTKRVLDILAQGPCGKAKLARRLGKAKPNRYLHGLIVRLLKEGLIARTRPDKPNSRLQAYRLTPRSYM